MKGTMSATPPDPGLWPIGEARQIVMVHLATKILLTKSLTLKSIFVKPDLEVPEPGPWLLH